MLHRVVAHEPGKRAFCRWLRSKTSALNFQFLPPPFLSKHRTGPRPDRPQCRPDRRGQERVAQRPAGAEERLGRVHAQVRFSEEREREREREREKHLVFFFFVLDDALAEQPAAGTLFFSLSHDLFSLPSLSLSNPTQNRNATVYVPYLNPNWNPVSRWCCFGASSGGAGA